VAGQNQQRTIFPVRFQVNACNKRMVNLLAEHEIKLDGLYYCPHIPEDYCKCRKPKTGMLQMAAGELRLDLPTSVMIGDNITDVTPDAATRNSGCPATPTIRDNEISGPGALESPSKPRWPCASINPGVT